MVTKADKKRLQLISLCQKHPDPKIRECGERLLKLPASWTVEQLRSVLQEMLKECKSSGI